MATTNPPKQPVALIIGASRGIGRQLALSLAQAHYTVVVSAKTTSDASAIPAAQFPPDPNSPQSTINTVVREIRELGHTALALPCDVRDTAAVTALVDETVSRLGSLDVLIYNSGAIWWSAVATTPLKRFQLMQRVNPEGLYAAVAAALPHFMARQGNRGRVVVVSPPIYSRFFRGKTAYAVGKVGMSVLTKGLAMDFQRMGEEGKGLSITSLWPGASIESAATERAVRADQDVRRDLRKPEIYGDAVLEILRAETAVVNGRLLVDEDWLRERGWGEDDFDRYNVVEGAKPRRIMPRTFPALEVEEQDDEGRRVDSVKMREGRSKL
ncbi:uncharacterized protein HMPREF1541_08150 [Cyphellophora europaea CBS 101466]|uniref:Short chain dehydrogenase n=1 Tax=Cyphellophora europaea (strain CBS 101466) TaxID=1220924 RepID=W2RLG4_CYPE1|nr:uncharacterized protein HMPREF1541_08150 [Cyphellophora europaea CBS 101466]ETN37160.1 hypothetical protein HMPREF1541_08150 [Cyphellophora europaea CBS 101466]